MTYPFGNVNIGSNPGDGTGDPLRTAFQIINRNFANVASGNFTANATVTSVAGRTGAITLTVNDVSGATNYGYVNNVGLSANLYTDSVFGNILANVTKSIQSNLTANINAILTNSSTVANIQSNVISNISAAVYANVTTFVGTIVSGNLAQVNANIAGANAAIITANNAVVAYVNSLNSTMTSNITSANAIINSLTYTVSSLTNQLSQLQIGSGFASNSQIAGANVAISALQANLGNYYTWANANVGAIGSNVANLLTNTASLAGQIVTANTYVINYVNLLNSTMVANVVAANSAIVTANNAVVGYVNSLNLAQTANVTAANTQILTVQNNLTNLINQFIVANLTSTFGTVASWIAANVNAANVASQNLVYAANVAWQANTGGLYNSILGANTFIQTLSANIGAYELWNNANASSLATTISTQTIWLGNLQANIASINANLGVTQIWANANIQSLSANIGSYYTWANANVAGLYNSITGANASIQTISANVGSYYVWANANVAGLYNSITGANATIQTISANLGGFYTWANTNFGTTSYSNANVSAYFTVGSSGNIKTSANVIGTTFMFANGVNILTTVALSSTYSNANVVANLANFVTSISTSANITTTANMIAPNYLFANGVNILSTVTGSYSNANVVANLANFVTNISTTGNLTFASNSVIFGDFTNTTVNYRTIFTTSTVNGNPGVYAVPNGSGTAASWQATNNSNLTNASKILIATNGTTDVQLVSGINGSGTYLPLSFYNGGSNQMQLGTAGNLLMVTGGNIVTTGNISAGNLFVNANTYHAGTTTHVGNVFQQGAYYETYSNISNSGGNLTVNFINGAVYYATLIANVTANVVGIANTSSTVSGFTIIVDQGATPYHVANIQFNGGSPVNIKWAGATIPSGSASNTDVISISLINLNNGSYRILGQQSSYA